MPRKARKYIESRYIHIIVQGINKEYIFESAEAKERYKEILKSKLAETEIKVVAYCIMDNHAHLLLYVEELQELTSLMQKTNTSYAKWYNKQKKRVGYVFRDRFFTQVIMSERQLINCVVYIHNNPVKAKMVRNPAKYTYSSYKEFIETKELITTESVKLLFGKIENYLNCFKEIHKDDNINDIMDIKDGIKESDEIINKFIRQEGKELKDIIKTEEIFREMLLELRHCGNLSLREMAKKFGISKDKLCRIINKNL